MNHALVDVSIAVALYAAVVLAFEGGFRAGRRADRDILAEDRGQVGAIQGAVLGLLGLLLAFSFAAAGSRFFERQDLITQEANAIGSSWLCADLLSEPHRSELRAALEAYTAQHTGESAPVVHDRDEALTAEADRLQARIWRAAVDGLAQRPELAATVVPPIIELFDTHALRVSAALKRLPALVLWLLVASSMLASAVIGYGCGMDSRRRWQITLALVLLIASALWITLDLDRPRRGLLQLDDTPLEALEFAR